MTSVSSLSSSSDLWASYRAAQSATATATTTTGSTQTSTGAVSGGQRPAGPPPSGGGGGGPDVSKVFDAADTNEDGTVSAEEAKALQSKINESRSTLLSIQEGSDRSSASDATDITDLFGSMDSDGDGSVSSSEMSTAKAEMASRPPPLPPPESSDTTTADGTSSDTSTKADKLFTLLDTSGDGAISKDEISLFLQSMASAQSGTVRAAP